MLKIWTRSSPDLKYLHVSADKKMSEKLAINMLEIACKEPNLVIDGINICTLQNWGEKNYEAKERLKLIRMKNKTKHSLLFEIVKIIDTEKKI